jgi:hypothetical protein
MAIQYVQSASIKASSGTTISKALTSNVTGGNTLLAFTIINHSSGSVTSITISDTKNVWLPATVITSLGGVVEMQIHYATNASAGATTVTTTGAGTYTSNYFGLAIHEYSGLKNPLVDKTASSSGSSTAPAVSVTTTQSVELVVAVCNGQSSISTVASPFTVRESTGLSGDMTADDIVSATGTYTATFTQPTTGTWQVLAASFYIPLRFSLLGVG